MVRQPNRKPLSIEKELVFVPLEKGSSGFYVKRLQEWLVLRGFSLIIDGDFGPITAYTLSEFQKEEGLKPSGKLDQKTWEALILPMRIATTPPSGLDFRSNIISASVQHLSQGSRELPPNLGPWVRLYMKGKEGVDYPWCAGFTSYILHQANLYNDTIPDYTFSAPDMFLDSKAKGLLVTTNPKPGDLFFVKDASSRIKHVGIVRSLFSGGFRTIEGNSNIEGSSNGLAVVSINRSFNNKSFISIIN